MKRLDRFAFVISLLLIVMLSSCMPTVIQNGSNYQISNKTGALTIIGASEDILAWEPMGACQYQATAFGERRGIVCPTPTNVIVTVGLDASGQPAKVTVQPTDANGLPVGIPK